MWHGSRVEGRDATRETEVVALLERLYRYGRVPRRHNCLERSLIMYRYLSELNAAPTLVVAIKRQGCGVHGHAWVVVDGRPLGEHADILDGFEPLAAFGAAGEMQTLVRDRGAAVGAR
jgi:hypothetical protein